jgi:hypothetical protein
MATFVLLPLGVSAQNKGAKDTGKTSQATAQDYTLLSRYTQIDGKVVSAEAGKITVSIAHAVQGQPNQQQQQPTTGKGKRGKTNAAMQQQQEHIEFELPIKDKAVIRKMYATSSGFDDKGNAKGTGPDAKKPAAAPGGGYLADIAELAPGTVVRLQLEAPKKTATPKADEPDFSGRPTVRSVTALSEPKDGLAAATNPKKKNQNQ